MVAFIVVTAWFATLLVVWPTLSASAEVDPLLPPPAVTDPADSSANPSFAFTLPDAGDTAQCQVVSPGGAAVEGNYVACTSPWAATWPADGAYDALIRTVRVIEPPVGDTTTATINSESPPSRTSYTRLPLPAPSAPALTSPPAAGGTGASFEFTVTGFSAATDTVRCAVGTDPGALSYGACTSPNSYTPFTSSSPSATYTVGIKTVRTRDGASQESAAATTTYVLDNTAPVISTSVDATVLDKPVWTVTTDEAATAMCSVAGVEPTPSACGTSYSATLPAEGTYTLTVTATDAAGNSATKTDSYTWDETGPGDPVLSGDSGFLNASNTQIAWNIAANATSGADTARIDCVVTHGTTTTTTPDCAGPMTIALTPADAGEWTLSATAYDVLNNPSAPVTRTVTYDPVVPSITINRNLAAPARQPEWTVTTDADATAVCSVSVVATTPTACGVSYTVDLSTQPGGTYTLTVTATDEAGNTATSTQPYVIAPAAPTVSVTTPGNSLSPTWTVGAQSGSTLSCTLTSPSNVVTTPACSGSSFALPLTQEEGSWTLAVTATIDGATSAAGTATYVLDTTPPGDVTLGGSTGSQNTTAISWTVAPGADTIRVLCQVRYNGAPEQTLNNCGATVSVTATGQGTWTLTATGFDAAGNQSVNTATRSVVYDTTLPAAPTVTLQSGTPTKVQGTTWSLSTTENPGTFRCRWTGPNGFSTTSTACPASYGYGLPDVDGTYLLYVAAVDAAGNVGPETTGTVVYDTTGPVVTFTSQPTTPRNDTQASWTTTVNETSSKTECKLTKAASPTDQVVQDWTTNLCGRTVTRTLSAGDGTYVLHVRDTDGLGNVDAAGSSSNPVLLDTTGPGAPGITGPSGDSKVNTVTWTITPDPADDFGTTYSCRLVTNGTPGLWTGCDTNLIAAGMTYSTTLADGTYRLDAQSLDLLGNPSNPIASSLELRIDTVAPQAPVFTGANATGNTTSRTWTWSTAEVPAATSCKLYSGASPTTLTVLRTTASCASPHTESSLATTAGTYYALEVTVADAATNSTTVMGPWYLLDTIAPAVSVVTGPGGTDNVVAQTYSFTSEAGSTPTCSLMQRPLNTTTWTAVQTAVGCASPWNITLPNVDGDYTVQVTLRDAAGNTSLYGESQTYTLDLTAPANPVFATQPTGTDNVATKTWTWSYEPQSTGTCQLRYGTNNLGNVACNAGTFTTTLTNGDGPYTLRVTLTDQYGNVGTQTSSLVYTLDLSAPAAPTVDGPAGPGNVNSGTYSIVGPVEAGATAECRLSRGTTVVSNWAACTPPTTVSPLGIDGSYVMEIRLTDQYGNLGPAGTSPTYVLDTVLPSVPVVTEPVSPSRNASPVFTFVIDADTVATCRVLRGATLVSTTANCTSPFTAALTGQIDGDYVLSVTSRDAAGNTRTDTSGPYTYDTTAPAPPVVAGPPGPSQDPTPIYTWTGESGTAADCSVNKQGVVPTSWTRCTSGYSPTLASDGTWVLSVRLIDFAGNTSSTGVSQPYVFDTTAPAPAAFTGTAGTGNTTSRTWTWTGENGAVADCDLYSGSSLSTLTLLSSSPSCTSPRTESLALNTPGTYYVLHVTLTDAAGNATEATGPAYLLDTVAPVKPAVSGPTGTDNVLPASYTFVPAETGLVAQCQLMQRPLGSPTWTAIQTQAACTSPWNVTLPSVDGDYTTRVTTTDAAGNTSLYGESQTYTLDVTGPVAAVFTDGPTGTDNVPGVTWTWTAEAQSTATCLVRHGTTAIGTPTACSTGTYSTTLADGDGAYTLTVTLTDQYGTLGASATSDPYTLDLTAPLTPQVTGPGGTSNDTSADYSFTVAPEAGATAECRLNLDGNVADDWAACSLPRTINLGADGSYVLDVRLTDQYGNLGPVGSSQAYLLDTVLPGVPDVTAPLSPSSNAAPVFTIVKDADTTAVCTLTYGATTVATAACGSSYTANLTGQPDGDYVLSVTATDPAGNQTTGTSAVYDFDTTGPDAPVVTGLPGPSQDTTPEFSWTGEAGTTAECSTRLGTGTPTGWVACTSPYNPTLPTDGSWVLMVRLTDSAGNVGAVGTSDPYVRDTTAPQPASFTGTAGTGNTTSRTWEWTGEAGAVADCDLYSGSSLTTLTLLRSSASCTSPHTETLTNSTPGTYYVLHVTLTDVAGNATESTGPAYLLDTVAPVKPTVDGPTGTDNVLTARYTFVPSETGLVAQCQLMQQPLGSTTWTAIQTQAGCASPWDVTLPAVDGDYTTRVTTTDAAGNTSAYGESQTYTLDVTGPDAVVFTGGPTGTDNIPAVTWTWTSEAQSTTTCSVTRNGTVIVAPEDCTGGSYSANLTAGDGVYTLTVVVTDQYGNLGGSATTQTYTLDLTPPGAPQVTGPGSTSNKTTADYSFTTAPEAGATAECRLTRDAIVVSDWAACSLPRTVALGADGSYVLDVRLTDQYGNLGPVGSSQAYLLDTKLPTVPVVTAPSSPSSSAGPVFTFVIDSDTRASCQLSRGSTVVAATPSCTGSFTGSLSGLADGDYVLAVTATDPAGNTATGSSTAYTYDTTAPGAPVVSGPAGPSQTRSPSFSWTGEAGARAECSVQAKDGGASGWTACASGYAPLLGADGTWVLSVRLIDAAGNIGPAGSSGGYLLDTTAPPTPAVTAPSSPGRDLAPSWSADTEPGSKTECRFIRPGETGGAFGSCTLPMTTPVTADGSYTFEVRATDAAGNVSPVGTGTYVLDTTAPVAPVVTQPASPSRNRTPSVSFTSEPGTVGSCRLTRGSTVVQESGPCSSPATIDLTGLPDGAYTLTVRAVDAAGNTGPGATGTYVLDTTAPSAPAFTLVPGSPSSDRAPTFGFSAEAGSTLACRLTTAAGGVRDLPCTSPLTLDLSGSAEGDYTLAITARDTAGNTSTPATAAYTLSGSAAAAPRVTGPATPGSTRTPTWRTTASGPFECRLLRGTTTLKDWGVCSSSYTADLYGQPDATYTFEARLVGTTTQTRSSYRLDSSGPTASITSPPSPSTGRRPTWSIASIETPVTTECRVTVFGAVLQDWGVLPCSATAPGSLFSYDLTGLGDGTYTLSVRLTDSSGNVGPVVSSDYVLDTSAPAAVGIVGPPSPGNTTTPTWTLTSTAGAKLECKITSGSKVIKEFAPCAESFTANLVGLPDGTYTLAVHALSAAGTPGPDATSSYVLKTSLPDAPSTLSGPTGPSRDRSPRWTFVLPSGSAGQCKVFFGGRLFREASCQNSYTLDLTNAADGLYALEVRAVDAAGNPSQKVTAGYTLRTVPAPAPEFTLEPAGPSSTTDPRWGFSYVRGVTAQCRILYDGATQAEDWAVCSSPYTVLLTGKPDGRYTLQVRTVDVAENTSSVISSDYVFDRTAPASVSFTETPVSPDNSTSPTWVIAAPAAPVTSTAPALVRTAAVTTAAVTGAECRYTARGAAGAWAACPATYTGVTSGDGRYVLEARMAATTGAPGPVTRSAYVLDTTPPSVPQLRLNQAAVGNEPEVSWSWEDNASVTTECRFIKAGSSAGAWATCPLPYTVDLSRLGQGTYTLEARATDLAGNVSAPGSSSYRFDTTPPTAPVFLTRPPLRGSAGSATWTFAVPADASALCVVTRDGTVVTAQTVCTSPYTIERMSQAATWQLSVRYVDTAGNLSPVTFGTYTLSGLVRDRVDGPRSGGGFLPPADSDGGSGTDNDTAGPTRVPVVGPVTARGDRPTGLGILPRGVVDAGKKAVKSISKVTDALPIPGVPAGTRVPDAIKNVIGSTITKPQLPLALFIIVVLFLLVQNRIDRRDPKLAAAPVAAEPELTFGPRVRSIGLNPGGATA